MCESRFSLVRFVHAPGAFDFACAGIPLLRLGQVRRHTKSAETEEETKDEAVLQLRRSRNGMALAENRGLLCAPPTMALCYFAIQRPPCDIEFVAEIGLRPAKLLRPHQGPSAGRAPEWPSVAVYEPR